MIFLIKRELGKVFVLFCVFSCFEVRLNFLKAFYDI